MPTVDSTGSPFAECETDMYGPNLEGRFFWARRQSGVTFSTPDWLLVSADDRTTVVGYIGRGSGYYSRDYRTYIGENGVARSRHETWSAAAHMLAAVVMERSYTEFVCNVCCETRIDRVEVYNYARRNHVCTSCAASRYVQCGLCDRMARPMSSTRSNGEVCSRHVSEMLACTMCHRLHRTDEEQCCEHRDRCYSCDRYDMEVTTHRMTDGDDRLLCDRCASRHSECSGCEYLIPRGDAYRVLGRGNLCYSCFDDDGMRQCRCGTYYDPDSDDYSECCEQGGYELIRQYSYKPEPVFHGEGRTFLGMEIEIKTPSIGRMARMATAGFGSTAILKHDGSISGGFEIVTHPMSYQWAMNSFSWQTLTDLAKAGAYADDACGIHVHVSKAGFANPAHDHRWYLFIHRNQVEVEAVARRASSEWAAFSPEDRMNAKKIAQKKAKNYQRYAAINSIPAHTYEMRVFASSLDVQQVKAAMGLVSATVEYTRQLSSRQIIRDNGWAWSSFARWVSSREEYAPLVAEMNRLNIAA